MGRNRRETPSSVAPSLWQRLHFTLHLFCLCLLLFLSIKKVVGVVPAMAVWWSLVLFLSFWPYHWQVCSAWPSHTGPGPSRGCRPPAGAARDRSLWKRSWSPSQGSHGGAGSCQTCGQRCPRPGRTRPKPRNISVNLSYSHSYTENLLPRSWNLGTCLGTSMYKRIYPIQHQSASKHISRRMGVSARWCIMKDTIQIALTLTA